MTTERAPLRIRRATLADAAAMARLMSDPAVQPNLMQLPYGTEEQWRARLAESSAPGRLDLVLVAERADAQGHWAVVGNAGLHPAGAALRRRHAMTLGIAIAAAAQGQGVGRALMQALLDYADQWGQVLRTELTVFVDNTRAVALYQSFGFRTEGRLVGYALRHGRYEDVFAMARWHPNPPQTPSPPVDPPAAPAAA